MKSRDMGWFPAWLLRAADHEHMVAASVGVPALAPRESWGGEAEARAVMGRRCEHMCARSATGTLCSLKNLRASGTGTKNLARGKQRDKDEQIEIKTLWKTEREVCIRG